MRWRRGLFRIWMVLCAAWISIFFLLALNDPILTKDCNVHVTDSATGELLSGQSEEGETAECESWKKEERVSWAIWGLAPPLTLSAMGFLLGWIRQGFRRSDGTQASDGSPDVPAGKGRRTRKQT
jgi:hypothetical protein